MELCRTCKWWQLDDEVHEEILEPIDPDTYEKMTGLFEVRYCKSPLLGFYERPVVLNGSCVVDSSQYRAELITAPEFGCVNHNHAT